MGMIPPRILRPLAKPDFSLLEGAKVYTAVNREVGLTAQEVADALSWAFGCKQESKYIDDGRGGIISVDSLTPITQYGNPEPIAYMDDNGYIYHVKPDEPRSAQYEDAAIGYENC